LLVTLCLTACLGPSRGFADTVVVFNEIMYHPATDEANLEWVELYNQMSVDVDLSGWRLSGGIAYEFPAGTLIRAGGYRVIARVPEALGALTGLGDLLGPFSGRMANGGDTLRLRDNLDRVMDSVTYGVDGDWPLSPDGAGPSLAKRDPNLASGPAESWVASPWVGGTPGRRNFGGGPSLGPRQVLLPLDAAWRFDDTGADLGAGWRVTGFDDTPWASGAGLFAVGDISLPGQRNTPLAPNRNTYYFRTNLRLDGDPAAQVTTFRAVVDDGAVFYVNGSEAARLNMPAGAVTAATQALNSVGSPGYSAEITVPPGMLVKGTNVIAVEVHQTTGSLTNAGLKVVNASGYVVAWDGTDGDYSTPASPATAPDNGALASHGVDVFASSNGAQAGNTQDGRYGQGSSWSPALNDTAPWLVFRFNQVTPLTSVAWGRDNGDASDAGCPSGTCTDHALGNFSLQYTLATNPAVVTASASNPSNSWTTIATVQQLSAQPGFSPHLRHRFTVAATGGKPILATGFRLRPPASSVVDEVEINSVRQGAFDAAFGMEVVGQAVLPPPPDLVFNEVSGTGDAGLSIEVMNRGAQPADLAGVQIVRRGPGAGAGTFTFPGATLPPGGLVALSGAQLAMQIAEGDWLTLYSPGGAAVLDAVAVKAVRRGRFPDGTGAWMYPPAASPGAPNQVPLRDDIVINEIMYHPPPLDPMPAVTTGQTLIALDGRWRYEDSGTDPGAGWVDRTFDDTGWSEGPGLFAFNTSGLSSPVGTVLGADRRTYYFRVRFPTPGPGPNLSLDVRSLVKDGAVFYLNGVEVLRVNMPAGAVTSQTPALSPVRAPVFAAPVSIPGDLLVSGDNVLAVEVHRADAVTGASGLVLTGGGLALVEEGPFGGAPADNLARRPGASPFAIDSLAGFAIHNVAGLTDGVYGNNNSWIGNSGSPGYAGVRFGGLFPVGSIAFGRDNLGTFQDRTLGQYTLQFTQVPTPGTDTVVTGDPTTGWATIGTLNFQRAGTGLFTSPSRRHRFTFTPVQATGVRLLVPATGSLKGTCIDELEVNPPDLAGGSAFGSEIVLTTTLQPARPFTEPGEQWVELFNRGSSPVDLSGWRLDGAIDFRFGHGPIVPPGGFVVVARHAADLRQKWPEVASLIVGDFSGRLRGYDRFLVRDAAGNPVSQARVFEGGWSDGGGSSLELKDSRSDPGSPDSWADSDEAGRAAWQRVTYRMTASQAYGPTRWNEFRLGLLDDGVVLVDDISVVRDPDGARVQVIQNGGFDTATGNTHWRWLGNHKGEFVPDPDNPGNRVLKVAASGRAVMNHNHVESTLVANTPPANGQLYEVSYRARWVAGSPQVSTRLYFGKLARVTVLPMPSRAGTPGAPNSRRTSNGGPMLTGLAHSPVVPAANQPVAVSVHAADPDGVVGLVLNYRVNPAAAFTSIPMVLSGGDLWTATVPGQLAGRVIHFYVTAADAQGATSWAPAKGPDSRALYQVADAQGTKLPAHELRLIMLDADRDFMLAPTNVMSDARLGGTLVYDKSEVFYDVGPRLQGTAASRIRDGDDYVSYDIGLPPGHLFRGLHNNIGIDRSGRAPTVRGQDEIYVQHLFHRAGVPIPYSDLCYFISPRVGHTGTAILQLAGYGGVFVGEMFGKPGSVFNMDITYEPDTTVNASDPESLKLPVPLQAHIGTDMTDLGDKEQYRSPFDIRLENRRDDYEGVMRLCRVMGSAQADFDARIGDVLDANEVLRMAATEILCGIQDTYVSADASLPHNLRMITFPDGDRARFLPWDMDFVFGAATDSSIYPNAGINLGKFIKNPATKRQYLYHVLDICRTSFDPGYMTPWLAHYGSVVGQNFSAAAAYITARRTYALSQLPARVPFAITSNGGADFQVSSNTVVLSGTGWVDVQQVEINGTPAVVTWTSVTNWMVVVPLAPGVNPLVVQAVDSSGARRPDLADTVAVTSTVPPGGLPVVINEFMAENAGPGGFPDPLDGLFQDWIELYNPNPVATNLSGWFLTDDPAKPTKWMFPANSVVPPQGFLLVWADTEVAQNSVGNGDRHASFKLSSGGDSIGLYSPQGLLVSSVAFGQQVQNVSSGLYPDGNVAGGYQPMPEFTPRAPNRLSAPGPLMITGLSVAGDRVTLTWTASPGHHYRLDRTERLPDGAWVQVGGAVLAAGATASAVDEAAAPDHRYYRVLRLD
jgi:hypothetical protein